MPLVFTFTADASGSRDAVTIPEAATYAGFRRLKIRPPQGHAWSYASVPTSGATGVAMSMDEEYQIERGSGEFMGGEVVLYAALDTGSGTFTGVLE